MPKILLLTAQNLPHDDHETALVAGALRDLGVESEIVPWTAPDLPAITADLAVIRTTWDYTRRLPEFLMMLEHLRMPVTNPVEVVRWNCHKGYLIQLAAADVPVVPTALLQNDRFPGGAGATLPDFGTEEVIVKPAISAGAVGVGRFAAGTDEALEHLRGILRTADALVQPFQRGVTSGERSLIHLGGQFSHAICKTPAAGDFRVQEQFGGLSRPHLPSSAELAIADVALAEVPGGAGALTYARIDVVGPADAPLIMELELIEPELFLHRAPGSAERFAGVLAALV